MTAPTRLEFSLAQARYLFSRATDLGVGGDKRKFWQHVMGFESAEAIRSAILSQLSPDQLKPAGQNDYGDRYQAVILVAGPSGVSWQIRTGWIVLFEETEIARFVTAVPERFGRQQ